MCDIFRAEVWFYLLHDVTSRAAYEHVGIFRQGCFFYQMKSRTLGYPVEHDSQEHVVLKNLSKPNSLKFSLLVCCLINRKINKE